MSHLASLGDSTTGAGDAWRHQGTFWVFDPERPLPADVRPRLPVAFRRIGAESAHALAALMRVEAGQVLQRFAAGGRCYVAVAGGAWAAYGWVSFHEEHIGEIGLRIRLRPGEAYIWDCETVPDYRRRRLYTALLAHVVAELRAGHITRIWIGCDTDNLPSQIGIQTVGFQPVADLLVNPAAAGPHLRLRPRVEAPAQTVADVRLMLYGAEFA